MDSPEGLAIGPDFSERAADILARGNLPRAQEIEEIRVFMGREFEQPKISRGAALILYSAIRSVGCIGGIRALEIDDLEKEELCRMVSAAFHYNVVARVWQSGLPKNIRKRMSAITGLIPIAQGELQEASGIIYQGVDVFPSMEASLLGMLAGEEFLSVEKLELIGSRAASFRKKLLRLSSKDQYRQKRIGILQEAGILPEGGDHDERTSTLKTILLVPVLQVAAIFKKLDHNQQNALVQILNLQFEMRARQADLSNRLSSYGLDERILRGLSLTVLTKVGLSQFPQKQRKKVRGIIENNIQFLLGWARA